MAGNSGNIGTLAATVVVKDTVKADMGRIKSLLTGEMKAVQEGLGHPLVEAERQLASITRGIEKLMSRSTFSLLSDREVTKLQQYANLLDQITARVQSGASGNIGLMGVVDKLNSARMGVSTAQQIGITNPLASIPYTAIPSNTAAPRHIMNPQQMGMPQGFGPLHLQATNPYIDPDASGRAARMARRDRSAYEAWWQQQNIAAATSARHVMNPNEPGLPAGFSPVDFSRVGLTSRHVMNPAEMGLPGGFGPINLRNRQTHSRFVGSPAEYGLPEGFGPVVLENIQAQNFRARNILADERMRRDPYGQGGQTTDFRQNQLAISRDLARQYDIEDRHVDKLRQTYARWSQDERNSERNSLRAMQSQGINRTSRLKALSENENDFQQIQKFNSGRGSYSHALQFGTQNAAFAVEDFLISTQYGGVKAGLRAITNNLTAMTAAATGAMNPFLGAGLISAVAVGGALAPSIYGAVSGDDERRAELINQLASPRESTNQSMARQFRSRMSTGTGVNSARAAYEESMQNVARFNANKADILRGVGRGVNQIGSERILPSEWVGAIARLPGVTEASHLLGTAGYALRNSGSIANWFMNESRATGLVDRGRNLDELLQARNARTLRDTANANIKGLGDPALEEARLEADRQALVRERRLEARDFTLQNRMLPMELDIAKRQLHGELINPRDQFEINRASRFVRLGDFRETMKDQPEAIRDFESRLIQEHFQEEARLPFLEEQFKLGSRDRGWQHRLRLAELDLDPRKRLAGKLAVQKEQILADKSLSPDQQRMELAALEKMSRRQLEQLGEYPGLGDAINIGSAEDVRLRQKIFDKSGGSGKMTEAEHDLKELIREIRALHETTKKNAPKVATVKKR